MTVSRQRSNRPFKFGDKDRKELLVQESEVALRAINDTSGNPIFLGRALTGSAASASKWQIRKMAFDSNGAVTSITWPQNDEGNPSSNYEFEWSSVSDLTITGITKANPAVVTVSSAGSIANGDKIIIQGVTGMTEVNFDGTNIYTVAGLAGSTFQLSGIDSTAYTAYSAGGSVVYGNVVNLTYA